MKGSKAILLLFSFCIAVSNTSLAQDRSLDPHLSTPVLIKLDCAPKLDSAHSPLFLVVDRNSYIKVPQDSMKLIKAEWIKSFNVVNHIDATKRYGEEGKNGLVEITLFDEKLKEVLNKRSSF